MRYDLAFFLCCCKSFLGSNSSSTEEGHEDFYEVLGIDKDATPEEIKRAYKRQSLQMHPDKLAQRGKQVTEADQAKFQRMKEAYEVLSDPHKKETYDVIGERGMKWIEEPFSLDPQEMARNFANSSTLDRSKIFSIFVAIGVVIFILPVLICLRVDGTLGNAPWTAVLTPLWIWNAIILFYHARIISMGPTAKPDNIPESDWVDPLPVSKRIYSFFRFCLVIIFELLVAATLDDLIHLTWVQVFSPIYIWEATALVKKIPLANMRIVTVEDLETALGKPYRDFTQAEKDLIANRYSVVPSLDSTEFEAAHKIKSRAKQDVIKVVFRVVFLIILLTQLETSMDISWWLVFTPFWIMSVCVCCGSYHSFAEAQSNIAEKDPTIFSGIVNEGDHESQTSNAYISNEEKEELKAQLVQSGYRLISSCCSQLFLLTMCCLFVGKLQGADYSSFWIVSPLLILAVLVLTCLGCTIFCITDISPDDLENARASDKAGDQNTEYVPPAAIKTQAKATWDPEKGQVWESPLSKKTPADPNTSVLAPDTLSQDNKLPSFKNEQNAVDLLDDNAALDETSKPSSGEKHDLSEINELD